MTKHETALSAVFTALADPTRRAIMQRLATGPASLGELAQPTGFALPTVQRHVQVLAEAGLIETEKDARRRICRARPETLDHARDWLARTRASMAAQTDRLSTYLDEIQKEK